jgi:DNA-binding MarR family transcriptional regulator
MARTELAALGDVVTPTREDGAMQERPNSRRHGPREYQLERLPDRLGIERNREYPPSEVDQLVAAGSMGSALRTALRQHGIDPKLARLVLLMYRRRPLCVSEAAWSLNVSPSTASRLFDRAERAGLVDKIYYEVIDRRVTRARLTEKGRDLRIQVDEVLRSCAPYVRPGRRAYGRRTVHPWDF